MNDDITAQTTASRQRAQRLRSLGLIEATLEEKLHLMRFARLFDATDALYKEPPSKETDEVIEQESLIRCRPKSDLYGSHFDSPRIGLPIDDLL
jgi:hypothetical protein